MLGFLTILDSVDVWKTDCTVNIGCQKRLYKGGTTELFMYSSIVFISIVPVLILFWYRPFERKKVLA